MNEMSPWGQKAAEGKTLVGYTGRMNESLYPGSYTPFVRGVIRYHRSPKYACRHNHPDPKEARECARAAVAYIMSNGGQLPKGWFPWSDARELDRNSC